MNILTNGLPEGIISKGRFYPVHTDFKRWIKIAELLDEGSRDGKFDISKILMLCYRELPETLDEALSGVMEFFSGAMAGRDIQLKKGSRDEPQSFSFSEDSGLIYAAFFSQYGIDLLKEPLHWYQFLALFNALSGEHRLFEVMSYRRADLSLIKDSKKRAFYAKMKQIYSLKDHRTEEEKSGDIANRLWEAF